MLAVGLAVTLAPVLELSLINGDQEYVDPPDASKFVLDPMQMVASDPALAVKAETTVMVMASEDIHPLAFVPVTV